MNATEPLKLAAIIVTGYLCKGQALVAQARSKITSICQIFNVLIRIAML